MVGLVEDTIDLRQLQRPISLDDLNVRVSKALVTEEQQLRIYGLLQDLVRERGLALPAPAEHWHGIQVVVA